MLRDMRDDDFEKNLRDGDRMAAVLAAGILLTLLLSILCGCSRKVYMPAENTVIRTDTVYQSKVRVDSVIQRDSVVVIQRGDTVLVTKYRDRYRIKEHADTVYQTAIDSVRISVPYPVERELTKWEQTKMSIGGWALSGIAIAICVAVIWIIRLKRRKS